MTAYPAVAPTGRLRRRPARLAALVVALVGLWILLGLTRAPTIAHDYWASSHPGATEVSVDIRLQPAVPPFWGVNVDGAYVEASGARVPSAMILWVEPFTGFVLVMGQG